MRRQDRLPEPRSASDEPPQAAVGVTVTSRVRLSTHRQPVTKPGRGLIGVALAALAAVGATVVAMGPAETKQATYRWPPREIPTTTPRAGWYTPLPLLNRVPEAIELTLPCGLSPPLRQRGRATVVSTARRPERSPALVASLGSERLVIETGGIERTSLPWPESCPLRLVVEDGELRLPGRTQRLELPTLDDMPIVTGLFTGLDLRSGEAPDITVRTRPYATSWSARQAIAALLTVILACGALVLTIPLRFRDAPAALRRCTSRGWRHRDASDAVVVGLLLAWWIVGPIFYDDGWLATQQRMLAEVGSANVYYDVWGVAPPFGYWLLWVRHWFGGSTNDLLVMRIPALVALLASWLVCRCCLRLSVGDASALARWALAGAFLVGSTAWGMTLRPEPFVSLLALVALASMLSFSRAPRAAPLAATLFAIVFALAAHPVGVVAVAPLIAASPAVLAWLRRTRPVATVAALLVVALASGLLLFVLGADLPARLTGSDALAASTAFEAPWWREDRRYSSFGDLGGDNPIRRLSLALMVLTVLAFLARLRSVQTKVSLVPARSLAAGLLLLVLVPSKWPWHFGGLVGLAALATSAEVARLVSEGPQAGARAIRAVVGFALLVVAGLWVRQAGFTVPGQRAWSDLDVRTTHWGSGFALFAWVVTLSVLALSGLIVMRERNGGRPRLRRLPSLGTAVAVVVLSFAAIGTTIAVLVVDAASSQWTIGRQNAAAFVGREGCGALDELNGGALSGRVGRSTSRTLVIPFIGPFFPCATTPRVQAGRLEMPDFVILLSRSRWPIEGLERPFAFVPDLASVRLIASSPEGIEVYAVDAVSNAYALLPFEQISETIDAS
jgi:hypothetical protein